MSTRESMKAFRDDVQKGLTVGVADMEVYGSAFRKKQGCLVDPWPEELAYSTNYEFISRYLRCAWVVRLIIFLYADDAPCRSTGHGLSLILFTVFVFRSL